MLCHRDLFASSLIEMCGSPVQHCVCKDLKDRVFLSNNVYLRGLTLISHVEPTLWAVLLHESNVRYLQSSNVVAPRTYR